MKLLLVLSALFALSTLAKPKEIDPMSGLVVAEGMETVRAHCMACHSAKLVSQNRMSRDSWLQTIRWMQKSQGLWPLGPHEKIILDYLETHYSPNEAGRRANLPKYLLPNYN